MTRRPVCLGDFWRAAVYFGCSQLLRQPGYHALAARHEDELAGDGRVPLLYAPDSEACLLSLLCALNTESVLVPHWQATISASARSAGGSPVELLMCCRHQRLSGSPACGQESSAGLAPSRLGDDSDRATVLDAAMLCFHPEIPCAVRTLGTCPARENSRVLLNQS